MPDWNEDQKLAIYTRDKGVIISAAAGSGKTAVLVERTVSILSDHVNKLPADRLLAVTFTNEAADQMRRKLGLALEEKLAVSEHPEEKKWLSSQRDLLPLARISTINSFCLDLVKRCLNAFDYEEGIRIIDENDAAAVLYRAFETALDELAEKDRTDFDYLYDKLGSTEEIITRGRALYEFKRSLPFPDEWLSERITELQSGKALSQYIFTLAYKYYGILDKAEKLNERVKANIHRFPELDKKLSANLAIIAEDKQIIAAIRHALDDNDWNKLWYAAHCSFTNFKNKPDKDADYPPVLNELFLENGILRDKEKKLIQRITKELDGIGFDVETPLKVSAEVLEKLNKYSDKAAHIAYKEKLKRNVVEFSDVEIMALSLLVKRENGKTVRTEFAEELRSDREYRLLLIDEFQDVNDLQELIFKALSDTDDLDVFGSNVFVVGDVKQSIYSFRLSNPKLFIKAREAASDGKNKEQLLLVELKSNYRSRGNIISFVNLVFSQIMSEEIGEVEYVGGERLHQGAGYKGSDPPVEVIFVNNSSGEADKDIPEDEDQEDDNELSIDENYAIAKRIRQLIDAKAPVYDKPGSEPRPCVPRDFCILYRSGASTETLKAALSVYGLKAAAEKSKGYLRSREISLMMSMLRMIDNPMRDIPMAAVMLSPIMGFTADELARVRLLGKQKKIITDENGNMRESVFYKHLYQIIASVGQSNTASHAKESEKLTVDDPVLEQKCISARELVRRLSFYSAGMELSALIRKIYDETDLLAAVSSYENSRQKRANLRLLLEYARSYSENSDGSTAGFIRYIESISASGKDFTQAATEVEDDNSVLVKSIHASKGLEFPFVFLCGMTKRFNTSDLNSRLLLDEEYGSGLIVTDRETLVKTETVAHAAIKVIKQNKLLSEELRLLYVAFTRAKEGLFLPLNMKIDKNGRSQTEKLIRELAEEISQAGGVTPRIVRDGDSYVHWIAAALLCSKSRKPLLDKLGITCSLPTAADMTAIVYSEYYPEGDGETNETEFYHGASDSILVQKLISIFDSKEKSTKDTAAAKYSVTEIVTAEKERQEPDKLKMFYPQFPSLDDEKGSLTPAQRGTCTHLFMELADLDKAEMSVKDELQHLADNGFFTEKEKKGVYVSALEKFFRGEFFARMKRSPLIMREKKFLIAFDDLALPDSYRRYLSEGSMLQGIADCIFLEDDGYVLVDYKTDNFKDICELYSYQVQLELYKAALDKILDKPVKACYIYSFKLSEGVEIVL